MKAILSTALAILLALSSTRAEAGSPTSTDEILRGLGAERGAGGASGRKGSGRTGAKVDLQVQFEYNSAQLTPEAVDQLQKLASALNDAALLAASFRIEGHTDSAGSATYNQGLSQRRAEAVRLFLVEQGHVDNDRLQAKGYGESRPTASDATEAGRALNRRVAVINLGVKTAAPNGEKSAPPVQQEKAPKVPAAAAPAAVAKPQAAPTPPSVSKPNAAAQGESAPGMPNVAVTVRYQRDGRSDLVKPGAVLRPVDNFQVSFTPKRDSYVYVFQFDSQGNQWMIFPNLDYSAAANPVRADSPYAVPSDGTWISLKETPGAEEIVVIASGSEIADPPAVAANVRNSPGERGFGRPVSGEVRMPTDLFSYRLPYRKEKP